MNKLHYLVFNDIGTIKVSPCELLDCCPADLDYLMNKITKLNITPDCQELLVYINNYQLRFHPKILTITALYLNYVSDDKDIAIDTTLLEETYEKYPQIVYNYFNCNISLHGNKKLSLVRYWFKKLSITPSEYSMQIHLLFHDLTMEIMDFYAKFFPSETILKYVRLPDKIPSKHDTLEYADEFIAICEKYDVINEGMYHIVLQQLQSGRISRMLAYELIRLRFN